MRTHACYLETAHTGYRQCHLWIDDECTVALLAKGQFLSMTV